MSGAMCERFPACMNATNDATVPKCDKDDCPGRPKVFLHMMPKPDACEHRWDGPMIEIGRGVSATGAKAPTSISRLARFGSELGSRKHGVHDD